MALPRPVLILGVIGACLTLLTFAHFRAVSYGEEYTGALALLDRLFDLSLALGLAVIAFAVGRAVGRKLSLDYRSLAEEVAFSVLMGTGIIGLSIFALGVLGLLSPVPIILLQILFVIVSSGEFVKAYQRVIDTLEAFRETLISEKVTGIFLAVSCLLLLPLYLIPSSAVYEFSLLQSSVVMASALLLAHILVRRFPLDAPGVNENISPSLTVGFAIVCLCVLGLNMIGLLSPLAFAGLELILLALFRGEIAGIFNAINVDFRRCVKLPPARHLCFMLLALMSVVLLLRAAAPPDNYDEAIYHLAATRLFVEQGRIYPLYDNALGNMPFLVHMMYAICLMAKADIAARVFSLILALTTALAVYAFCARFLTRRVGWLALFGLFGAGMVTEVAVTARIDVTLTGMLFAASCAMTAYLESRRPGWLYVSAMLAGFSLGLKLTAVVWLLPIGAMFLYESFVRNRAPLVSVLKRGVLYAFIVLVTAAPWYVKNYVWFGNPAYPFLTGELAEYEGGRPRYFTLEDDRKLEGYFNEARNEIPGRVAEFEKGFARAAASRIERHPWRVWEYFLRPEVYEVAEQNIIPNYLFLALPLLLFAPRRRWLLWLTASSVFCFLFITRTVWIARYWLPMFPVLAIGAVYALDSIAARVKRRWSFASSLAPAAIFLIVAPVIYTSMLGLQGSKNLSFIMGETSRREFLSQRFYYPSIEFVNRQLPTDARVMMMGAQMNYDLKRPFVADTSWDGTDWQRALLRNSSLEQVSQDLKRRGITHIVYSPNLYFFAAEMGPQAGPTAGTPARRTGAYSFAGLSGKEQGKESDPGAEPDYKVQLRVLATFELFRMKFLERVYQDKYGYEVYRIL